MSWSDFEHQMWALLKAHGLQNREKFLVAVSGGLDSMAVLHLLRRLKPTAQIRVAHFHHGDTEDQALSKFRDEAFQFVKHNISSRSLRPLHSESDMREARWDFLRTNVLADEVIVTGHHLDDWFETALLKMIRGTSIDGISGLQMWNGEIFRPFLKTSKRDLKSYVDQQGIRFLEDPSNDSEDYLRNWVRGKWLKDLEAKQKGASENLAQSLLRIIEDYNQTSTFELKFLNDVVSDGLDRSWFLTLSHADQLKAVALYLKNQQIFEMTRGQLEEIVKRLDKNQKDLTFELFSRKWVINASQIMLR